jgi:hypothetical protein
MHLLECSAQFKHVAEHGDAAPPEPTGRNRQQLQRRPIEAGLAL